MGRPLIGLALGAGAARGWAHIGVLKSLEQAGIYPDIIAGTSIGAVAGGCYAADKLEALEEFACNLTRRRIFGFLDFNFAGSGLITGQRLFQQLDQHLASHRIEMLPRKFVAVATELGTGHEIWLNKGRLVEALCASYALPGVFRPVRINGRWLIDGALVNPIPVSVCRALGARIVIAVSLNWDVFGRGGLIPQEGAIDEEATEMPHADESALKPPGKNGRAAMRLLQRQLLGQANEAPGISSVMMDAINITQDRIARSRLAGDPPDITIAPRLTGIGLFDFHRACDAISIGAAAIEREVDEIKRLIHGLAA